MQFRISKTNNGMQWIITPLSGVHQDTVIAVADAVNMTDALFDARTCVGAIKATWGLEIINTDIYHDMGTLRGLMIGKTVDVSLSETLHMDYDGFYDVTNHKCRTARRLLCFGNALYAKGAN